MQTEIEATFRRIDKEKMREKLRMVGAVLKKPEFLQKRNTFALPKENNAEQKWLRVRDEGDKITLSLKEICGTGICDQKEICLKIDDFGNGTDFLQEIGCKEKSYQETLRELWLLDNCEIMLDTWPFLEPFVEIEGESEESVKSVAEKLGFVWSEAYFGAVDNLYAEKYGITAERINNQTPLIKFEMENPFM